MTISKINIRKMLELTTSKSSKKFLKLLSLLTQITIASLNSQIIVTLILFNNLSKKRRLKQRNFVHQIELIKRLITCHSCNVVALQQRCKNDIN